MKRRVSQYLLAALLLVSPTFVLAEDFKSVIFTATTPQSIHIDGDHSLRIRNFTQEGGTTRGVVTVTFTNQSGGPTNVLAAAIIDSGASATLEIINSVVIAGPADVTVTCGDATGSCFITYKKDDNS